MSKITIETISQMTGLSRGTISRALNDRPDISQATKQRVLEACRKLNYSPSPAARALATGRNRAIAVVLGSNLDHFGAEVLLGAIQTATGSGFALHVTQFPGTAPASDAPPLAAWVSDRVDAALIVGEVPATMRDAILAQIGTRPFATIAALEGGTGDRWMPDDAESGALVARHLLKGAPDGDGLVYLHRAAADPAGKRRDGFLLVCEKQGVRPKMQTIEMTDGETPDWGALNDEIRHCRALAASDDQTALQAVLMAQRVGRVPGADIRIVGQGNEPFSRLVEPALSTVDWSGQEVGRRAMEGLLLRERGDRLDAPLTTLVAPRLVLRQTA